MILLRAARSVVLIGVDLSLCVVDTLTCAAIGHSPSWSHGVSMGYAGPACVTCHRKLPAPDA